MNICKLTMTKIPKKQPNFSPPNSPFVAIQGDVRKLYFLSPGDSNAFKYIRSSGPNPKGLEECKCFHVCSLCSYPLLPLSLSVLPGAIKGHSGKGGNGAASPAVPVSSHLHLLLRILLPIQFLSGNMEVLLWPTHLWLLPHLVTTPPLGLALLELKFPLMQICFAINLFIGR